MSPFLFCARRSAHFSLLNNLFVSRLGTPWLSEKRLLGFGNAISVPKEIEGVSL